MAVAAQNRGASFAFFVTALVIIAAIFAGVWLLRGQGLTGDTQRPEVHLQPPSLPQGPKLPDPPKLPRGVV